MSRVIAYIDGMNLYHGLRDRYGRRLHWLNLEALVGSMLRPHQRLVRVNYFTARVRNQPMSELRQETYLAALAGTCRRLHVIEGRFQERRVRCRSCGVVTTKYDEKETDINIALALLNDVVTDTFDTALLLTADADLRPAIMAARRLRPGKRFIALFPPGRHSDVLRRIADGTYSIGADKIRQSQLPDKIILPSGVVLERPAYWRPANP